MAVGAAFRANGHDHLRRIHAYLDGNAIILSESRPIKNTGATQDGTLTLCFVRSSLLRALCGAAWYSSAFAIS